MIDSFVDTFLTKDITHMKSVKLRNAEVSDSGMQKLLSHHVQELELIKCANVSQASLEVLNMSSDQLYSLSLGPHCSMFPDCLESEVVVGEKQRADDFMMTDFEININGRATSSGSLTYKQRGEIVREMIIQRYIPR